MSQDSNLGGGFVKVYLECKPRRARFEPGGLLSNAFLLSKFVNIDSSADFCVKTSLKSHSILLDGGISNFIYVTLQINGIFRH